MKMRNKIKYKVNLNENCLKIVKSSTNSFVLFKYH